MPEPEAPAANPAMELLCSLSRTFPQRSGTLVRQIGLSGEPELFRRIRELRVAGFDIRVFRVGLSEFLVLGEWQAEEADRVASAYWRRVYGAA